MLDKKLPNKLRTICKEHKFYLKSVFTVPGWNGK